MKITIETKYLNDLSATATLILAYLQEHPNAVTPELMKVMHRSETSILTHLRKLESYGFIERQFDKNSIGRISYGKQRIVGARVLK